mgnify:CR=1 FL=1
MSHTPWPQRPSPDTPHRAPVAATALAAASPSTAHPRQPVRLVIEPRAGLLFIDLARGDLSRLTVTAANY